MADLVQLGHHLAQLLLHVPGADQGLDLVDRALVHLPGPLQLVLALVDHVAQGAVLVHELHEGFLEAVGSVLLGVGGEADEVEVPLDEVDDHPLPVRLPVLGGRVVLVLGLDDPLPEVVEAGALGRAPAQVDHLVRQLLAVLGRGELLQQLLHHLELAHQQTVLGVLALGQLLEGLLDDAVGPVPAADAGLHHLVELGGHLHGLDDAGHDHAEGCPAAAHLGAEDALRRGGVLLHQRLHDHVEAVLGLGPLLQHRHPDHRHALQRPGRQTAEDALVALEAVQLDCALDLLAVHRVLGVLLVSEHRHVALATLAGLKLFHELVL